MFSVAENPQAVLLDSAAERITHNPPQTSWRSQFPEIIGRSPLMCKALETVSKVARSSSSVLILGESGTGKELIASAIHRLSPRSHRNFVAINCSAIPEELLEAELFGHEKGSFTGADRKRIGKFEAANGGTIFLDEIGDMSHKLQAKLLRVLEEMQVMSVGSNEQKKIDVRVIAATNIDVELAIQNGSFRLDLYYRLNVLPIKLPALRERENDAILLLEHFAEASNRERLDHEPCWFAPDALKKLSTYTWPGNVRQLQNTVKRLVVLKGGRIGVEDLPTEIIDYSPRNSPTPSRQDSLPQGASHPDGPNATNLSLELRKMVDSCDLPDHGLDLTLYIENIENKLILQALERTNNNKQQAAKLLGLNRTTLVERIKKRKIQGLNAPSKEL
jgi:transcriptional regulator with GAF, ATPase, and Fis domain